MEFLRVLTLSSLAPSLLSLMMHAGKLPRIPWHCPPCLTPRYRQPFAYTGRSEFT
jgi:hypothetical protein